MGGVNLERVTSRDTAALANRIAANNQFGSADLTAWLQERIQVRPGEKLLEIGCGTGKHLVAFAKAGAVCTGVDVSAMSLQEAEAAAAEAGVSPILRQLDMDDLAQIDARFDTILSIYALYYSRDAQAVLSAATKMLNPGGRLAIFGPYSDNNAEWFDFIGRFMSLNATVKRSTTSFMYDEVLRFASENFGAISCERFVNRITIPDIEALRRYWRSNIYYDEALDDAFEGVAREHFRSNSNFRYRKVGQLILMTQPLHGA